MVDILDRLTAALADRYAIERELGSGGMATVYLAEDLKLHRQVAIKVLRPELAVSLGADRSLGMGPPGPWGVGRSVVGGFVDRRDAP